MNLSFEEILDWKQFEDLVKDYFIGINLLQNNHVTSVFTEPSGEGADGGRDILVTFTCLDSVIELKRRCNNSS